jgi:uncharacterized RDD family membrane protein YckC
MPTNVRDPRSIVTPEAFEIDHALLGTPLARPLRRLIALLLDLLIIGVLTVVTSGIGLLIWGAVGVLLVGVATRGPGRKMGRVTSVLFRGSIGCLGLVVLLVVISAGIVSRLDTEELARSFVETYDASDFAGLPAAVQLQLTDDPDEAREAALALLRSAASRALETPGDEGLEEVLATFVGDSPEFTDDPRAFVDEMVARFRAGAGASSEPVDPPPSEASTDTSGLGDLSLQDAVARYSTGLGQGLTPEEDPAMAMLRARVLDAVAGDTLGELRDAVAREQDRRRESEDALVEARRELDAQGTGFVALLRDIWDQAGLAVGLWSIYFTVTLTLFKGFTVGKRALGIRVVRLDGEPMNWWSAFERAGGYVAGIATGLLGFAQVYWDPNRQCVHDKIVGTVVVVAGAAPEPGAWESAWSDHSAAPETSGPPSEPTRPRRPARPASED